MTIRQLQRDHAEWAHRNFGHHTECPEMDLIETALKNRMTTDCEAALIATRTVRQLLAQGRRLHSFLGVVEEVGELAHANLKDIQGIRGDPDEHIARKRDAVADTLIFLLDYCTKEGFDLELLIAQTWPKVKARDWKQYPLTGMPVETSQSILESLDAIDRIIAEVEGPK